MEFSNRQQIQIGAVLSYVGIAIYILVGLLYTPWMIHTIGKDDFGLYTLANSIIALFVFDFGISTAIQRFVAKYLAESNSDKVNNCISIVSKLYIYIDVIILITLIFIYIFIPTIYRELTTIQIERLKIVFLIASGFSVISFPFIPINGILSAHEKFIQLKSCDLLSKVLSVSANVTCLYLGGGLYSLVISNVVVGIIFIIVKYIVVKRETNIELAFHYHDKTEMLKILSFSGWTTVVSICQRCIFNIAPSIIGLFAGAGIIAVFGIAITLEQYTYTFAFALNGLFLPKISRIINNGESVLPLMIKVGRIQIFLIGILIIGFIVVGRDFIIIWLGDGFEEAYICSLLIILPGFLLLPADVADQTLIASGNVRYRAYVYIVMALFNIAMSLVLTYIYSIKGLALSIFLSYIIRNFSLYYVYYKILDINIFRFFNESFLKMSFGLIMSLLCSSLLCTLIPYHGWALVFSKAIVVIITYLVIMFVLALNKEEKKLMFSVLGKIRVL